MFIMYGRVCECVCVCTSTYKYVCMYVQCIFIYIRAWRKSRAGIDRQEMTQTRAADFHSTDCRIWLTRPSGQPATIYVYTPRIPMVAAAASVHIIICVRIIAPAHMRHFHNRRRRRVYGRSSVMLTMYVYNVMVLSLLSLFDMLDMFDPAASRCDVVVRWFLTGVTPGRRGRFDFSETVRFLMGRHR